MARYHYLGALQSNLGKALQYVAEYKDTGEWLALLDWGYASLKNSARDEWLGWSKEYKTKWLKYVVTNTRFLILPGTNKPRHLASQVLSLNTARLSTDWSRYHGHHVFLAETFVDVSRFRGTCYLAANWLDVGITKGFGRSNTHYVEHGDKKRVLVYELHRNARKVLGSETTFPHRLIMAAETKRMSAIDLNRLPVVGEGGLIEALSEVYDERSKHGKRYKLSSILALTVCAVLTGIDSFQGIMEFGLLLPEPLRILLGFRRGDIPNDETFRVAINRVDVKNFDRITGDWLCKNAPSLRGQAIAVDGKTMRASRNGDSSAAPHILSVLLHHDGVVIASKAVSEKSNEIPAVREILEPLDIRGAVVTLDAMHTQRETARTIVAEKGADYVMTVKENQPELLEKLQRLPDEAFSPGTGDD